MKKRMVISGISLVVLFAALLTMFNFGGVFNGTVAYSDPCSIAPDGLDVDVQFRIEDCALVFTWNTDTGAEAGTSEVFWTTEPRGEPPFPNHKVKPEYTYNNSISIDVSNMPTGAIRYYVRSTAACGTWYQIPIKIVGGEPQLDPQKVTFPANCEPESPYMD